MFERILNLLGLGRNNAAEPTDPDVFRQLTENSADVIIQVGEGMTAKYVSPSVTRLLGWAPEEMLGKPPDEFIYADDLPQVAEARARKLAGVDDNSAEFFRMYKKGGGMVWVEGKARPIRDPKTGELNSIVLIVRDYSERKEAIDRLAMLAETDGLTGLGNRHAFDTALEKEWKRTLQAGTQISLLLLDLDHFKSVNDAFGHQVGDDCLRAAAKAAAKVARGPGDRACRYGGEEITVILPNTDMEAAVAVAEELRLAVEALHLPSGRADPATPWLTTSIGVATALSREGGSMHTPEALLAAADRALYDAKNQGRNCVRTALMLAPDYGPQ